MTNTPFQYEEEKVSHDDEWKQEGKSSAWYINALAWVLCKVGVTEEILETIISPIDSGEK